MEVEGGGRVYEGGGRVYGVCGGAPPYHLPAPP